MNNGIVSNQSKYNDQGGEQNTTVNNFYINTFAIAGAAACEQILLAPESKNSPYYVTFLLPTHIKDDNGQYIIKNVKYGLYTNIEYSGKYFVYGDIYVYVGEFINREPIVTDIIPSNKYKYYNDDQRHLWINLGKDSYAVPPHLYYWQVHDCTLDDIADNRAINSWAITYDNIPYTTVWAKQKTDYEIQHEMPPSYSLKYQQDDGVTTGYINNISKANLPSLPGCGALLNLGRFSKTSSPFYDGCDACKLMASNGVAVRLGDLRSSDYTRKSYVVKIGERKENLDNNNHSPTSMKPQCSQINNVQKPVQYNNQQPPYQNRQNPTQQRQYNNQYNQRQYNTKYQGNNCNYNQRQDIKTEPNGHF